MTVEQIITLFEGIIDDTMPQALEISLMNLAKYTLENERNWSYLRKLDTSQTAQPGNNFQTYYPLPADFGLPSKRGIYVGNAANIIIPYVLVDFEDQILFNSVQYTYYIDYANLRYALCGLVSQQGTIQFFYNRFTPDLVGLEDSPQMPSQFQPLLAMYMAMLFFSIDQGDKNRAWDDRWNTYFEKLRKAFISWDARLQIMAVQNGVTDNINFDAIPNMVNPDLM